MLRTFSVVCLFLIAFALQVRGQNQLTELGQQLTEAFATGDEGKLFQCFNTKHEVHILMETVNRINGGEGVLEYEVDSVYDIFRGELQKYFFKVLAEGRMEKVKWKKIKLEAISLNGMEKLGDHQTANILMVIRDRKNYYMISFPQSFRVNSEWKIGAVIMWEGRREKTED